jgi:hypothetical protein
MPFGDLNAARSAVTLAVTALAVVLVLGLVAPPSSTAGRASLKAGKPVITRLRGAVIAISAEGGTVAIHSRRSIGNRTCDAAAAWTPASGRVVRFGAPRCALALDSDENLVGLTLAGGHIAFVDYQFGNHAYCAGPYVATLAKPKPASLHRCHPEDSDVYWEFFGGGGVLAARSYLQCTEICPPN